MSAWLDLIGSMVIGSLLALTVMQMNESITEHSYQSSMTYIAQSNGGTISDIIEDDFWKMGFGVAGTAITAADTNQIQFLADLGNNGSIDTLTYYIGQADTSNSNPERRSLYRQLNSATLDSLPLGFTDFSLSYFGAAEDSLTLPAVLADIRQVRVDYRIESAEALDSVYSQSIYQLRFRPKNLDF